MQLSGKHSVNEDLSTVWDMLMNPEVLARIVPGISKLERIDDKSFESTMEVKIGPVSGSFKGTLVFEEINVHKSTRMRISQYSKMGNADAVVSLNFASRTTHQTELTYNGNVKLAGMLANTGQRLIGGVADSLIRQFFSNLDKELSKHPLPE